MASAAAEEEPASAQLSGVNMFQHVSTHQIKKRKIYIYQNITDPVSCGCMWCYDLYIDVCFNQFLYLSLTIHVMNFPEIQELRKLILGRVHNRQNKWQVMGCFE